MQWTRTTLEASSLNDNQRCMVCVSLDRKERPLPSQAFQSILYCILTSGNHKVTPLCRRNIELQDSLALTIGGRRAVNGNHWWSWQEVQYSSRNRMNALGGCSLRIELSSGFGVRDSDCHIWADTHLSSILVLALSSFSRIWGSWVSSSQADPHPSTRARSFPVPRGSTPNWHYTKREGDWYRRPQGKT